jgi:membrane dipeptidase
MLAFDWHLDLSWNALEWNRDLGLPAAEVRKREAGQTGKARGNSTVTFSEMRRGRVAVTSATLLARFDRAPNPLPQQPKSGFCTPEASYATAQGQLAYYHALEKAGTIRILRDWPSLESHTRQWQAYDAKAGNNGAGTDSPPLGFVISMEGADPILAPDQLEEWWSAGLRIISLSHYGVSRYSHGTGTPGPLTELGIALLKAMEKRGMVLDLTHLADQAMDQAMDIFGGTVLASHSNCRALVNRQRQLTDDNIRRITKRGGVIGAAFDAWMLDEAWVQGTAKERAATLSTVVDHIDRVCQLAGDVKHSALGTDLDGGFGTEQSPADLDTIADLQKIPALLENRGYKKDDIEGIMYRNWLELMRKAWTGK